jgi:hypothetical protein
MRFPTGPRTWLPLFTGLFVLLLLLGRVWFGSNPEAVVEPTVSPLTTRPQAEPTSQVSGASVHPLPDIDHRQGFRSPGRSAPTTSHRLPESTPLQTVPGLNIDFDLLTGSPKWIASTEAFLTDGLEVTVEPEQAARIVRQFIDDHEVIFGHGSAILDEAREVANYSTGPADARKIIWHQRFQGIEIFEAVLQANLTKTGALINLGSQMVPVPSQAAGNPTAPTPEVTASEAIQIASNDVGDQFNPESLRSTSPPSTEPDRRQQFRAALVGDIDAKLTWLPLSREEMILTWDITATSLRRSEMYRTFIDAKSGKLVLRQSLTAYNDTTYRVFTAESPTPKSPGHETVSSMQPTAVDRQMVTLPSLNATASPNGWISAGSTITSGNNANAYTDTDNNNVADEPRIAATSNSTFDHPLDLASDPLNSKGASVTQLFYWVNFMHDKMYELGFTEAAGNFQLQNFGRGGVGGDPVNAEALDGGGSNNANFSTPVDGGRGRMQMYRWTAPTPDRDGSFEADVVLHEYTHGVSNRLVGGPTVTITQLSSRGMGEGWSDFYGLALTAEEGDNPHGNTPMGAWHSYFSGGWFSENYYYGSRRYSYSTDMGRNPLTFKDIDPGQIDLHVDVPRNPTFSSTQDATQVHFQGTVWCSILWELRANLIGKHGFPTGNQRALLLVTEGMKLGPANPNFIQSRDAILQATMVNHPEDIGEIWTAFAKRGMGQGATAPPSSTTTGVVESFSVPDPLEIDLRSGWTVEGEAGGTVTPATTTVTLSNDGGAPLSWSANPEASWLLVSPSSGTLAPGSSIPVEVTVQAADLFSGLHGANVVFTNSDTGFNQPVGIRLYATPPPHLTFNLDTNPGWSEQGDWDFGEPTGFGSLNGYPDPTSGATGTNVYGTNLHGDVDTFNTTARYLTTSTINCLSLRNTHLRFKRWLNTNSLNFCEMTVEVTNNGVDWVPVYVNPGSPVRENSWTTLVYDISTIADGKPSVSIRWGYRNSVGSSPSYSGWNIDDIELLGESKPSLHFDLTNTFSEGQGPVTGTLSLSRAHASPISVSLSSGNMASATVSPQSLSFAPGETSKSFTVTPVDDPNLDGTNFLEIRAFTSGLPVVVHSITVTDNESATLTLAGPGTITEGTTGHTATISVSSPPSSNVMVALSSSNSALSVIPSIILPAGSTVPVIVPFSAPGNDIAGGPATAVITATVAGWTGAQLEVAITDDDVPLIEITGPSATREGDAPLLFTARVNTVQSIPLSLDLESSAPADLDLPATLTIPAGQFTADFIATVTDNAIADGTRIVTINADTISHDSDSHDLSIADNEVHHYTLSAIPSPQVRLRPFQVAITARAVDGAAVTNHVGEVTLSAISGAGAVTLDPTVASSFLNGVSTVPFRITDLAEAVTLTASDGNGKSGTSNAFDVVPGPVLTIKPGALDFSLSTDSAPIATNLTLSNPGIDTVEWEMEVVDAGQGEATDWISVDALAGNIPAGELRQIGVTLDPTARPSGPLSCILRFHWNDTSHPIEIPVSLLIVPAPETLTWTEIPSPQYASTPFAATLSALDSGGQIVLGYNETVTLHAKGSASQTTSGTGGLSTTGAFGGISLSNRMQAIYTPAEVGPAGWIDGIALNVASRPGVLQAFTVRLKHTAKASFAGSGNAVWESDGWTTISNSLFNVPGTGWVSLPISEEFHYDGSSNLMVDVSFDNPSAVASGSMRATIVSPARMMRAFSSVASDSPLAWTGSEKSPSVLTLLPNLRFSSMTNLPCQPGTLQLVGGTWSGNIQVDKSAAQAVIVAKSLTRPTFSGSSNPFAVTSIGSLTLTAPSSGTEGAVLAASVASGVVVASDTIVSLVSSDPAVANLPGTVTIPAGSNSANFSINLPDDALLERLRNIELIATAAGYDSASSALAVTDDEPLSISIALPSPVIEGSTTEGSVSLPGVAGTDFEVSLTTEPPGRLSLPATVTIPVGESDIAFTVTATQNNLIDGNTAVAVTASLPEAPPAEGEVDVIDDEVKSLSFSLPSTELEEGAGPVFDCRVKLTGITPSPLQIVLLSSDPANLTVVATVDIPAGSDQSGTFVLTPVDNSDFDGSRMVTLTASVAGFSGQSTEITVRDDDLHHFDLSDIPDSVGRGESFPLILTARDIENRVITGYAGTASLTVQDGAAPLDVTPSTISDFTDGVANASVIVEDLASAAVLTATDTESGGSGTSNAFEVVTGPAATFQWSAIPLSLGVSTPFPVSLSATDRYGNTATTFTDTASLHLFVPLPAVKIGNETASNIQPLGSQKEGARSQFVLLANEMGEGKVLSGFSLNVNAAPSLPLNRFTIRLKHTDRSAFSGTDNFENTGFTTVYSRETETVNSMGWVNFTFDSPFVFDGVRNLLIDISFDNETGGAGGLVESSPSSSPRHLFAENDRASGYGDPKQWTMAENTAIDVLPNLRWQVGRAEALDPIQTGQFVAGEWSGIATVASEGHNLRLLAVSGEITGLSGLFSAEIPALPPVLSDEPLFSGGTSNTIHWSLSRPEGEVQVQRDESAAFSLPVSGLWKSGNSETHASLEDGSTYHYRAKSRYQGTIPALVEWSQTSRDEFLSNTGQAIDLYSSPGSAGILGTVFESFESPLPDWNGTLFTQRTTGTFSNPVSPASVPSTDPFLPISADPDREGEISGSSVYALQPTTPQNLFSNGSVTAYVYPRNQLTLNHAGVMIRASGSGSTLTGYVARLNYNQAGGLPVWVGVSKIVNGSLTTIIGAFASTTFDPQTEHFKIQIAANGSTISASLWKVTVSNGSLVETPIATKSGTDSAISTGVAGIYVNTGAVFDDVAIVKSIGNTGTLTTPSITPPSLEKWGMLDFSRTVPTGSSVTVDVLDANGNLVAANIAPGSDLALNSQIAALGSLRLRANLSRSDPTQNPQLHEWSLSYSPAPEFQESDWSNVVTSTQDASPPSLSVTHPVAHLSGTSHAISGQASDAGSGVDTVTVAGIPANSNDGYLSWTSTIPNLAGGANSFTAFATDQAVPPNTATVSITLYRIVDPVGDTNGNGIPNLLEHALAIPADSTRPDLLMPQASVWRDPTTGASSLQFAFRRRLEGTGLQYRIDVSDNLNDWTDAGGRTQVISTTPNADGVTETVVLRISPLNPAATGKEFLRLRVTIP